MVLESEFNVASKELSNARAELEQCSKENEEKIIYLIEPIKISFCMWKWKFNINDVVRRTDFNMPSRYRCRKYSNQETISHLFLTSPTYFSFWKLFASCAHFINLYGIQF